MQHVTAESLIDAVWYRQVLVLYLERPATQCAAAWS